MRKKIKNYCGLGILTLSLFLINIVKAQTIGKPKSNWQNLDLNTDGVFGISMEKTYAELLKGKKAVFVTVAVIDGGVDIEHPDLKPIIWTNSKEIPGNGIDDDRNNFIDDVHGWNFYNPLVKDDKKAEMMAIKNKLKTVQANLSVLEQIIKKMHTLAPSVEDFKNYIPKSADEFKMQKLMVYGLKKYSDFVEYKKTSMERAINYFNMQLDYYKKQDYDPMIDGPSSYHGTHVSGIIAAVRNNNIGIKGVSDHAKIMVIKAIQGLDPIGDETEQVSMDYLSNIENEEPLKAFADALRYAADNGAKVINISIGFHWTKIPPLIDNAIKYAISKDVLIIHASGNLSLNMDQREIYPNRKTLEGQGLSASWIEVSASGWKNDKSLPGEFANYGEKSVDVYAPGINIISTTPRNQYLDDTGTSMAAPVVTGLAATIRAYYPKLSARQVKEIIVKSIVKANILKHKCISGGIVNAYKAFQLAKTY